MSTDMVVRGPASDLTIGDGQTFFTDKQVAALRQLGVSGASNADLAVFFHQAVRTGLDPFARQVYMIERQGKQTIQTGIDGFRLVARRATDRAGGSLGYEDTEWCGPDGAWVSVWLSSQPPAAARVTVLRDGQRFPGLALYSEYVGTKRDGKPTSMWASKPALMLAKCAEALALRRAFPQDLSGLYTSDEMPQDDSPRSGVSTLRDAVSQRPACDSAPTDGEVAVERDPAEPTDVVDAEIVDDGPFASPPISPAQMKKLHALLREHDANRREDGLALIGQITGLVIGSTKDLTRSEASAVIDALEAAPRPAQIVDEVPPEVWQPADGGGDGA